MGFLFFPIPCSMGLEAFPWQGSQGARKPAAIERIFPQPPANCPNALHGKFYSFESRCGCFPVVSFKNASLSERSNMLTKGQHSCLRMNEFITLVSLHSGIISPSFRRPWGELTEQDNLCKERCESEEEQG